MCPHKRAFVLSQSITGTVSGTPKISCPNHKKPFSLLDGTCLTGEDYKLTTFPTRYDSVTREIHLLLPPTEELDRELGTGVWMVKDGDAKKKRLEKKRDLDLDLDGGVEIVGGGGCAGSGCGDSKLDW